MSYTSALQNIASNALSLLQRLPSIPPQQPTPSSTPKIEFQFPLPTSLDSQLLVAIGLDSTTSDEICQTFLKVATRLRVEYEAEYARRCTAFASVSEHRGKDSTKVRCKLLSVMVARYQDTLSTWANEAVKRAESRALGPSSTPQLNPIVDNYTTTNTVISRFETPYKEARVARCDLGISNVDLFTYPRPIYAFPSTYPPPSRTPSNLPTELPRLCSPIGCTSSRAHCFPDQVDMHAFIEAFSGLTLSSNTKLKATKQRMSPSISSFLYLPSQQRNPRHRTDRIPLPSSSSPASKFSSKITPFAGRPVSPVLETSPAITLGTYKALDGIPALGRKPNMRAGRPSNATNKSKSWSRKSPSFPREVPYSNRARTTIRSTSFNPRTSSLMSDSGTESSSSSPRIDPVTPPSYPAHLLPVDRERIWSPDHHYLSLAPRLEKEPSIAPQTYLLNRLDSDFGDG